MRETLTYNDFCWAFKTFYFYCSFSSERVNGANAELTKVRMKTQMEKVMDYKVLLPESDFKF